MNEWLNNPDCMSANLYDDAYKTEVHIIKNNKLSAVCLNIMLQHKSNKQHKTT